MGAVLAVHDQMKIKLLHWALVVLAVVIHDIFLMLVMASMVRASAPEQIPLPTASPPPTVQPAASKIAPATATSTKIPPTDMPQDAIPAARFDYFCDARMGRCVQSTDTTASIVTHVLFNEGGGVSNGIAADVLQIIHNRCVSAWTCSYRADCYNPYWVMLNPKHIAWEEIGQDAFERLILYLLSQPYLGGNGKYYAAFNGWYLPLPWEKIQGNTVSMRLYDAQYLAVENWLINGRGAPVYAPNIQIIDGYDGHEWEPQAALRNINVQYFFSTINKMPDFTPVACDSVAYGDGDVMYVCFR
jgi:hypothetical protein